MRRILCWGTYDGQFYLDRAMAVANSGPTGHIKEVWGEDDKLEPCSYWNHSPECRGPGDLENHILPLYREKTTSQLMGIILACCGDEVSPARSCPCSHVAQILVEKLQD